MPPLPPEVTVTIFEKIRYKNRIVIWYIYIHVENYWKGLHLNVKSGFLWVVRLQAVFIFLHEFFVCKIAAISIIAFKILKKRPIFQRKKSISKGLCLNSYANVPLLFMFHLFINTYCIHAMC